jgi:hypothetical protein
MPEGQGGSERTATRTPVQRDPKVTDLEGKSQYKDPFRGVNRLEAANAEFSSFIKRAQSQRSGRRQTVPLAAYTLLS